MTQPALLSQLSFEDALAIVAAAQAAQSPTALAVAAVAQLSDGVAAVRDSATQWAVNLVLGLWRDVNPYDGRAVQAFTEEAALHVVSAQSATAQAAAAAQAQILSTMGVPFPPAPSDPVDVRSPGVDVNNGRLVLQQPDSVRVTYDTRQDATIRAEDFTTVGMLNRPARTYRALVAQGAEPDVAQAESETRLVTLVEDNVMLAQRFAEAETMQNAVNLDERVIGYRRVIHPELSRTGVCGLCIAAADQMYAVGTLLPIHDRCKCTIAPVTEDHDPADDVNAADLRALYKLAGGTSGAQLKRVRYQVDEHGELGPTLIPKKKYKPRSSKRITAGSGLVVDDETTAQKARRLLPGLERSLDDLLAQGLGDDDPKVRYHREQIARHRAALGQRPTSASAGGTGGPPKPPDRVRGMLGPDSPDEFGEFDGYTPPALRSQIDEFTLEDALSVLDGEGTPTQSDIASGRLPHGGHRFGTGWGKTEFDQGWDEHDVVDFVRAIIDAPTGAVPITRDRFALIGTYLGQHGRVIVRRAAQNVWYVATAHPTRLE